MAKKSNLSALLSNQGPNTGLPTLPNLPQVSATPTVSPTVEDMNAISTKKEQETNPVQKAKASTSAQPTNESEIKGMSNRRSKLMGLLKDEGDSLLDYGNQQPQQSNYGSQVVNTAAQYLGVPYVWGGTTPQGFDCSGLMQYAYAQNGISIPRTSQEQFKAGTPIDINQMQPGDLVFFSGSSGSPSAPGHVAMYAGNGNIIEAPQTGDVVKVRPLSEKSAPVGARRYQ